MQREGKKNTLTTNEYTPLWVGDEAEKEEPA